MRDDLIDAEEVEESKALSKALRDTNIDPKFVENLRSLTRGFTTFGLDELAEDFGKGVPVNFSLEEIEEADLAEKWEKDFYDAHPELRGLIAAGILVLNGQANIGYPGGDLIFNVSGTLICHGTCFKPWGVLGDHIATCPIFGLMSAGANPPTQTQRVIMNPPLVGCSGPCCNPNVPMPGIQATADTVKPMDKKAAGWKGHEYYGYDSDYD